jgi:hypothetical protein
MEVVMPRPLPDRPNLEQLKKQAKSLLHAAQGGDAAALSRFTILPAFANKSAGEIANANPALHDAQSVIARAWLRFLDGAARRSRSANAVVRCRGRRIRPLRNRWRGGARQPSAGALPPCRARDAANGVGAR